LRAGAASGLNRAMKTILNSTVLSSTLVALVSVLAGCGDDDSAGGASCAQVCAKVEAAKCKNDPDCTSRCNDVKDSTPMGCAGSYNALATCYAGAKFTCDADEESVAKECSKQETAYAECRESGGKDDGDKDAGGGNSNGDNAGSGGKDNGGKGGSGGAGTGNAGAGTSGNGGTAGTGSGDSCSGVMPNDECGQCLKGSCCDDLLACHDDSDCLMLTDCVGNCSDSSCIQTCADSVSSSAVDLYNTFIDCASNSCESECSDGSSSGSDAGTSGGDADVGQPNDGNGGHPSGTTPTNCLPVSSGITGYCDEVKYKVIYDCPDGAPYDDCELNKIDSSGIYCCGH
jgi:hypothetical protein